METDKLNALTDHLNKLGYGSISNSDTFEVLNLLSSCWLDLQGSDDQKTDVSKLHRAESLSWDKPMLSFTIERHGGTVNGSSRAALHHWVVDLNTGCANISLTGVLQLTPMSPKMDIGAVAEKVANQILLGKPCKTI